ncbi:MAG TPA: hypothetical protein VFQ41_20355 [Candidatus Angelobacter sp.]|nr:hypothetical protein [Candidatus Angelobacter sp.]
MQVVTEGADEGIKSYLNLRRNQKRWNIVQRVLGDFQDDPGTKGSFIGWPQVNLASSYLRLVHFLVDLPPETRGLENVPDKLFREIVDCFDKELSTTLSKPRSRLEDIIVNKSTSKAQRQSLMQVANEIYHHNFGIGLTASPPHGLSDTEIAVQTRLSKAFLPLYKSHTPKIRKISTLPLQVRIPDKVDYSNGNLLVPLFDTQQPIGRSRADYLQLRVRYLAGEVPEDDMLAMAKGYQVNLDAYWNSFARHGTVATHLTNAAVTSGIVLLSVAGIGTAAVPTVVIGTVAYFATEFGVPTLMEKWDLPKKLHLDKLPAKFKPRNWQSALSTRSALISLTVNPSIAQSLAGPLPPFA